MKISTLMLSLCGFCIFYICNADWIDELYEKIVEDYLGNEYEEFPPFVSSVTAGTEEFDRLVEELSRSRTHWLSATVPFLAATTVALIFSLLLYLYAFLPPGPVILKAGAELLFNCYRSRNSTTKKKDEIQKLVTEFLDKKLKQLCGSQEGDDVPVKLLWKGGSLVESTIHCNIKDDSKLHQVKKRFLHSTLLLTSAEEIDETDKSLELYRSESDESTAQKIVNIRKMLESEQEIKHRFVDKGAGTDDKEKPQEDECRQWSKMCDIPEETEKPKKKEGDEKQTDDKVNQCESEESEIDGASDPKLMNRIRLLESRLRLEELKNKNWINRMTRAEGILQQLNKQVDRGIDSMSKGVNSGLISGRANRGGTSSGDPHGDPQDHQHRHQLAAVFSSSKEHALYPSQSVPAVLPKNSVHVAE